MVKAHSFVSVIIPCRNEEKFISRCLDSMIQQTYPKKFLEILVIDGMSTDQTAKIIKSYVRQFDFIKYMPNPKIITPAAFNLGIENSKGDFIMLQGAHSTCAKDFIAQCLTAAKKNRVDNVGGLVQILPSKSTLISKSIALALASPFGAGNAHYKTGVDKPKFVDTVFGGFYQKKVFDQIGLFNEKLIRSQDIEFNLRLKKAGGQILLCPHIKCSYYARPHLREFIKHNFLNGVWAILPFKFSKIVPVAWRHLIPLFFVLAMIGLLLLIPVSIIFLKSFLLIMGVYLIFILYYTMVIVQQKKDFKYCLTLPLVFATLHISYGLGSVWGLIKLIFKA